MRWAYGVTTVPERNKELLPRTLRSLKRGGFDQPHLFVDGCTHAQAQEYERRFGLVVTARCPRIRTYGNWVLGLAELYLRDSSADRYAMFQDDLVCCADLRGYLERCEFPTTGYWNCYSFPSNESYAQGRRGWYESRPLNSGPQGWQSGRGALMLVFNNTGVRTLLTHQHMVDRPLDVHKGWKNLDGAVVTALNKAGWREYVHMPSLVQHTGAVSTMRHRPFPYSQTFPGEEYSALRLLG